MVATRVEAVCQELRTLSSVHAVFVVDAHRRCIAQTGVSDDDDTQRLLSFADERPEEWGGDDEDWWCSFFAPCANNEHVMTHVADCARLVIVFTEPSMAGVIAVRARAAVKELDLLMLPRTTAGGGNPSGAAAMVPTPLSTRRSRT